jgi:hypothetical protein
MTSDLAVFKALSNRTHSGLISFNPFAFQGPPPQMPPSPRCFAPGLIVPVFYIPPSLASRATSYPLI